MGGGWGGLLRGTARWSPAGHHLRWPRSQRCWRPGPQRLLHCPEMSPGPAALCAGLMSHTILHHHSTAAPVKFLRWSQRKNQRLAQQGAPIATAIRGPISSTLFCVVTMQGSVSCTAGSTHCTSYQGIDKFHTLLCGHNAGIHVLQSRERPLQQLSGDRQVPHSIVWGSNTTLGL